MIFNQIELLRIVKPIWYYYLNSSNSTNYWIDYRKLSISNKQSINFCTEYISYNSALIDAAYQIWIRGFIDTKGEKSLVFDDSFDICINDQYRFIRRMFKQSLVYYILFIRLISFKNPLKELLAFFQTRNIQKININYPQFNHDDYNSFNSKLIIENPLVSIIIPTLNRYLYLKDALHDLEKQEYVNFEVIIVDQSEPFYEKFYKQFNLDIILIRQKEMALWLARNNAIRKSKGDYILFYEDDVRVQSQWILNHLKTIDYFQSDVSVGVFYPKGEAIPIEKSNFHLAVQFPSGNAMVKKTVFKKTGLFDCQFERMRMGDGEFGARCIKNGMLLISNPKAFCEDMKATSGGFRQIGISDAYRSRRIFASRPIPSVLYLYRKYWGDNAAILKLIQAIPFSLTPYRLKGKKIGYMFSVTLFTILLPFILIQVYFSWYFSSKMLKSSDRIGQI